MGRRHNKLFLCLKRRDTVITKSLLVVRSSIILLILIAFPEGLQCGTIYKCVDKNGTITLSDRFLEKGYNCKPLHSFKDITDEDRKAWEIEKKLSDEKWEKYQAQEEKERIERRKKEFEAAKEAAKEQRAEETLRAAQAAEEAANRAEANAAAAASTAHQAAENAAAATSAAQ